MQCDQLGLALLFLQTAPGDVTAKEAEKTEQTSSQEVQSRYSANQSHRTNDTHQSKPPAAAAIVCNCGGENESARRGGARCALGGGNRLQV